MANEDLKQKFGAEVAVPQSVSDLTEERNVTAYDNGEVTTLHFHDVHTTSKGQSLFDKIGNNLTLRFGDAGKSSVTGSFTGGELSVTIRNDVFKRAFG